jgi:hypothetical protein
VISFRAHVVTIVAVFLALAIGVLGGSAFVQPALQQQLETRTNELLDQNGQLRQQIDEVRLEIGQLEGFADAALPYLTSGRLTGTPVIIVTQAGVADEVLSQAQSALIGAGANILATISASDRLASDDPATQQQLELPALTAQVLAERLTTEGSSAPEDDVLGRLLSAGFLAPIGVGLSETTLQEIGAPGQVVLVLSGGRGEDPALLPETFAIPLVRSLATRGAPVAAGEPLLSDYPYVALVRDGDDGTTLTVDDLDQTMGGAALVLGIEDLLTTGRGGAYGVKDGSAPLPPLP